MMPENRAFKKSKDSRLVVSAAAYSGPLPSAEQFERYERAVPGAGARILGMAEKQSQHRQDLEKRIVSGSIQNERLGSIFAFIIALAGIGAGTYLVSAGKSGEGLAAILTPLCALSAVFFYKSHKKGKDTEKRY